MELSRTSRLTRLAGLAVPVALALTACGTDSQAGAPAAIAGSASAGGSSAACATGSLTAAGSSAQKNAMDEFIKAYQQQCSGTTINYQSVGSGAGVQQFLSGTVDFAGSDSALKDDEHAPADKRCATGAAIDLPMVVGPVAITYNLPGVKALVLDAPTVAKIFAGTVKTWDDPAIAALNAGTKLPSLRIQAFHRSDESGTTDNVQKYLTAAAPAVWTFGTGKKFLAPGGQAAKGNEGTSAAVKQTEGAVSYNELSFAQNADLGIAKLATGAAEPVELTTEAAGKAVEAATVAGTGNDLALKLDYATKAEGAYPLVLVTYEIVCEKGLPADKAALVKSFLTYTSSTQGQGVLSGLGYAPLPETVRTKVAAAVAQLG